LHHAENAKSKFKKIKNFLSFTLKCYCKPKAS